jgi:hypothetical protein
MPACAAVPARGRRLLEAERRSQSALLWLGFALSRFGYEPLTSRGLQWKEVVANHQAITTAVRRSKLYVEPPLLPNGPFVQQVAAALPGSSRSAAPTHAAPAPVSIGVIRLCDYDPAVTRMTSISARNGVLYTRRHGYTMYMEGASLDATRPAAWSKVPRCRCRGVRRCRVTRCVPPLSPPQIAALRKYLWEHDWVLWMDCDSLFMNMDTSLESVLMSALAASEHPETVNVVVSNDGTMVNTGTASWLSAWRVCVAASRLDVRTYLQG